MQIFVKTTDGKTVVFEIVKTEKICDIKKKVQQKIGLAPDKQILIFQGGILEDDKNVEEYQITERSVINVVEQLREGMQIYVKTMDGETEIIEILKTEKICDIKRRVQEKLGIDPEEQKLVFQGGILEVDKTVEEYQITERSVINVVEQLRGGIQIFAKTMDGKIAAIEIVKTDKIFDIKKKVQQKLAKDPDKQKLVFEGVILEDDKNVEEYQITERSVIYVVLPLRGGMQIFVKSLYDGNTVAFEIVKTEKICDIKRTVQEKVGIDPEEQILEFRGVILEDDKNVEEYQITERSTINVIAQFRPEIQIFAKSLYDGNTVAIEIVKTETIHNIKYKYQQKTDYRAEEHKLIFNGRLMEDDKTAEEYQITDGSKIYVVRL